MEYYPRALRYLRPHWRLAVVIVFFMIFGAFLTLLTPWPLKVLFDSILGDHALPSWARHILGSQASNKMRLVVLVAVAYLVLIVAQNAVTVLDTYVKVKIEQRMMLDYRTDLFARAMQFSMSLYDERRSGLLIYAINFHADAVAAVVMIIPDLTQSALTIVGMLWIMWALNHTLAILSLTVIPFLYYSVGYYIKKIQTRLYDVKMMEGDLISMIHDAITNLKVIVTFGREGHETRKLREQGEKTAWQRINITLRQTIFSLAVNIVTGVGTALVLGVGAYYVLRGQLTGGELLVFMSYIALIYKPLETISATIGSIQDQLISLKISITQVMDREIDIRDATDAVTIGRASGDVQYESVSFNYNARDETLKSVSFSAHAGEVLGIVGPTGAGKSTLVSLLPRLYDPHDGRILLDGIDIRKVTLASLREQISVVLQEPQLFSGTIAENIRYGRLDASTDEIYEAAKAANAHDFITRLPESYETHIGERGAQLSGGERQRIAIARAFIKNAPILILDEPTSAIDSKTESIILDALDRLMVGRTTFIVAHRLSTLRRVDRILVLDHGCLVEQGTHAQLIAMNGLYTQLHDTQSQQINALNVTPESTVISEGSTQDKGNTFALELAQTGDEIAILDEKGDRQTGLRTSDDIRHESGAPAGTAWDKSPLVLKPGKIVVLGMMTRHPVPGVIWQTMQYIEGLRRLGFDVYYFEEHALNPSSLFAERPQVNRTARAVAFLADVMWRFSLEHNWAYRALHEDGAWYGMDEKRVHSIYHDALAILNLHGGTQPLPDHYATGRLIYVETDPVALQIELYDGVQAAVDHLVPHSAFFTYAENLGQPDCLLPSPKGFKFLPTRQPVVLDFWPRGNGEGLAYTTIGNWQQQWRNVTYRGDVYTWSKHEEFLKFIDLPRNVHERFELALSSGSRSSEDVDRLISSGWSLRDSLAFDLDTYRDYIRHSRAEFTVAKDQNVRLRTGWFSDRSATYLASGRPVITQDTGFGNILPTGRGLFPFTDAEDVAHAVQCIRENYQAQSDFARSIAEEYFRYDLVLGNLLARIGISIQPQRIVATTLKSNRIPPPLPIKRADYELQPLMRQPMTLSRMTFAAMHELPIPDRSTQYDLLVIGEACQVSDQLRLLLGAAINRGHRVFVLQRGDNLAAGHFRVEQAVDRIIEVCLTSAGDDSEDCEDILKSLEAVQSSYGIETAIVWTDAPTTPTWALEAAGRWGWKFMTDEVLLPGDGEALSLDSILHSHMGTDNGHPAHLSDIDSASNQTRVPKGKSPEEQWNFVDAFARSLWDRVSVVIVAWNNLPFTRLCIDSIINHTGHPNYELVIVDNGSDDGTAEYLRSLVSQHAHARVVTQEVNRGFAAGVNRGIRVATGSIIVLLNNDTVVTPGWLTKLVRHLKDPAIGIVGAVTNHAGDETEIPVRYTKYGEMLAFAQEVSRNHAGEHSTMPMVTMFCAAMRRQTYDTLGPLDERFTIGMFEDDDYAIRAGAAGYEIVCAEDVFVHHFGHASISAWAEKNDYGKLFHENKQRFEEKWGIEWQSRSPRATDEYNTLRDRIGSTARSVLPRDATILVVSKGDETLLDIDGRRAWHFPRAMDEGYAGYYPEDSTEAIAHLEALRAAGANYILIPHFAMWWLEHYADFATYLATRYQLWHDEPDVCRIYALDRPDASAVGAQMAYEVR